MMCLETRLSFLFLVVSGCGTEVLDLRSGTYLVTERDVHLPKLGIVDVAMELDVEKGYLVLGDAQGRKRGEHVLVQDEIESHVCSPYASCVSVPLGPPVRLGVVELHDVLLSNGGDDGREIWFEGMDAAGWFSLQFSHVEEPPFRLPSPSESIEEIPIGGYECEETATPLDLDEVGPLGFTGRDIAEFVEGQFDLSVQWNNEIRDGDIAVDVGPEIGASSLELTVSNDEGEFRYVESSPGVNMDERDAESCRTRLEMQAEVEAVTAGGAILDRTYLLAVQAEEADRATLSWGLIEGDHQGTLTVEPADAKGPTAVGPSLVSLVFSPDGITGTVSGKVLADYTDDLTPTVVEYATIDGSE